ncbi:MAG: RNA polymerase sigma factor [Bacillota bacterium]
MIVNLYRRYIFAVVLPIVKNPADAEDISQEVFIRAYERLASYQGGSFKAWLGQIAVRSAIDHWRKLKRRPDTPLDEVTALPEKAVISLDDRLTLSAMLSSLSSQQQEAIQLYYYQGLSYREIAARLGVAEKTVESLLYRARGHLRHEWQNASEGGNA